MEKNTEKRKNHNFETLRGKIKLTLPSFSPDKKIGSPLLNSCSPDQHLQQAMISPTELDLNKSHGHQSFLDTQKFHLKNVFQQKYDILQKLGQGANGVVRKCKSKTTAELFAVKIGQMQQEHKVALKRIVMIMRRISHDNILKMKELYVDTNRSKYYQVIQYLPFPSLKQLISRNYKFISSTIEKIMKQLLQALEYFHKYHIVHRDIKTSNLLFDPETQKLYVIDLGIITKTVQRDKRRNLWTNTGTLEYKAPQMLEGSSYNQSVDLWAAAIVLYELVEGKTPFRQQTQMDIIENIRQIKYKFTPELWVDMPLAKLLVTRLLKPKSLRLSARAALKDPWFQLMAFDFKLFKSQPLIKPLKLINASSVPHGYNGFCQSGAVKKSSMQQDGQILTDISQQSRQFLRVSSYQSRVKSNVQIKISFADIQKMLEQQDIINNN